MRLLEPQPEWTGMAASGFTIIPADPARNTAKPSVRLLTPPRQRFTDTLLIGVTAFANDGGTLIGGIDRVRFHFEGSSLDVLTPLFHTFHDINGMERTYYGYWATLKRPASRTGIANLYIEAIPADATMQARVMGPFAYSLQTTLHDLELTIDPDVSVSATNYHTFNAAIAAIKAASPVPANPRITFKKAMADVAMTFAGVPFTATNYVTVEAEAPVSFGYATLDTTASVDTNSLLRPNAGPIWLRGKNITVDFANADAISIITGHEWVLDGIALTNSDGPTALYRGGINNQGRRVIGNPWLLECRISNLANACVGASLVRGCTLSDVRQDIFSDARCIVGTRVERHSDAHTNNDIPALTVVYTGSQPNATIARSGGVDPNNSTFTFKWGINTATFATGKLATFYARTAGDGYTFADLVDWINGTLAGLDAGWSATLLDTEGRRASSASLLGLKGQPFGATNCKTTPRQIMSNFDAHGDWYQQYFTGLTENVIAHENIGFDMQTQNIFLSSTTNSRDMVFVNNALANDVVGSDYFDQTVVQSQLGRSSNATVMSHIVIAHCSMPNQTLSFRNDGTVTIFDAYCVVANNAVRNIAKASISNTVGAIIRNNHLHGGQTSLAEAVDTTIGGDQDSLFANFNAGDFAPAGALLTNLKVPVIELRGVLDRAAPLALGAHK